MASRPNLPAAPVEIVVELQRNERWEATGPMVDDRALCPGGSRYLVTRLYPETRRTVWLWKLEDLEAARSWPTEPLDVIFVREYSCDDGTGAFTVEEYPPDHSWTVVDGSGAYSTLVGVGRFSVVLDQRAVPTEEFVTVELDLVG